MPASRYDEREHNSSRCHDRATSGTEAAGQGARHSRGNPVQGGGGGRTLTVFRCFRLDGRDVSQRVGELLAAGPERRRLGDLPDPVCLLIPKVEDGRLALQERATTQSAASDKVCLELGPRQPCTRTLRSMAIAADSLGAHASWPEPTGATSRTEAGADAVLDVARLEHAQERGKTTGFTLAARSLCFCFDNSPCLAFFVRNRSCLAMSCDCSSRRSRRSSLDMLSPFEPSQWLLIMVLCPFAAVSNHRLPQARRGALPDVRLSSNLSASVALWGA